MRVALGVVSGLFMLDVVGYVAWMASGQVPVDGFYVGAITAALVAW